MHFSGRFILKKDILGFLGDVRKIFKGWLECGVGRVVRISTEQTLSGTITEVCQIQGCMCLLLGDQVPII